MNPSRKELRKAYEKELRSLQEELVKLQLWIKRTGARIIIVFEGRDAAAKDALFAATDTETSPWYVVPGDDKRSARLNCISHLLSRIPYEEAPHEKITLPGRQKAEGYEAADHSYRFVPQNHKLAQDPRRYEDIR